MSDDKSTNNPTIQGASSDKHQNNVTSIEVKDKRSAACKKQEAVFNVARIMKLDWGEFGRKLQTVQTYDRSLIIVEIDSNDVCHVVSRKTLEGYVIKYLYFKWNLVPGRTILNGSDAKEILNVFEQSGEPAHMDDIKPVGHHGKSDLCWARLEWPLSEGDTPTYDELFGRMSDGKVVKAWIGSLFHADSDRAQYMWIASEGGDGKSSLANVLGRILGIGATSEVVPDKNDKFWTSGLVGKRLVCFPDADNERFVGTGLFKGLTGDKDQKIEFKGQTPVKMKLNPKFLFLSNKLPNLTRLSADIRRAILIELGPAVNYMSSKEYDRLLWEEAPHFIHECLREYKLAAPNDEKLEVSGNVRELIQDTIEEGEEAFEIIYKKHFKDLRWHLDDSKKRTEARGKKWDFIEFCFRNKFYIDAETLGKVYRDNNIRDNQEKKRFASFLKQKYGMVKKRTYVGQHQRLYYYYGIQVHTS